MDIITFEEFEFNYCQCRSNVEKKIISFKGTNGSGKSTIPFQIIANDEDCVMISSIGTPLEKLYKKPIITYSPRYNIAVVGRYETSCGGCDAFKCMEDIRTVITMLWPFDVHILYEGVIVSHSKVPWYEFMVKFNNEGVYVCREVLYVFLQTPLEDCLKRIYKRNGGKQIKEDMVEEKHRRLIKSRDWYEEQGGCKILDLHTQGTKGRVFNRFLDLVGLEGENS